MVYNTSDHISCHMLTPPAIQTDYFADSDSDESSIDIEPEVVAPRIVAPRVIAPINTEQSDTSIATWLRSNINPTNGYLVDSLATMWINAVVVDQKRFPTQSAFFLCGCGLISSFFGIRQPMWKRDTIKHPGVFTGIMWRIPSWMPNGLFGDSIIMGAISAATLYAEMHDMYNIGALHERSLFFLGQSAMLLTYGLIAQFKK